MYNPNNVYLLFEKAVRSYPDSICIITQSDKLTYQQTEREVSKVYNTILLHAQHEEIIGIPTTRCVEQIIFVLAVLKAGKAYLPIDFGYPKKRLESIFNNSKLSFCLTTSADENTVLSMGLKPLIINDLIQPVDFQINESHTKNLITYILYTSGSTGEPKGVCMGEKATANLIDWQNKNSTSKNGTRTLQFAPLSFDVSFQEIAATLSTGGTLVLINDTLRLDMVALLNFINEQQINRLFLPFVALQAIAEAALSTDVFPTSLKEIMTAGEQLKITPQVRNFFTKLNNCVLYNQYGPTECHVVTELKLEGNPTNWPTLPTIGKPISNTSIFILDQNQEILPDGTIGELCIAGDCLAEGYLNNNELTQEKFINWKSPDGKTFRMYRTGDLAQYLPDGTIEFLGRQDDQVKISGHRIELAEIELAINSISGIQQTVVIASNHLVEQTQLVAYMQSSRENAEVAEIRQKVSELLPDYMVPSYFMWVENFPKTSSGKIDKKNLPAPQYSRPSAAPSYKTATTKIQKNVIKVWEDLLHIPEIGIDDNFFELGGTSLLAQKVVAILLKDYNYTLPVTKLYRFPRIAEISNFLQSSDAVLVESKLMKETTLLNNTDYFNPFNGPTIERVIYTTQSQAEIWISCKLGDRDANRAYNESVSLILIGSLNEKALLKAIQSVVERHEALRSVFSTDGRFMTVFEQLSIANDHQDLSGITDAEKDRTLKNYLSAEANYVFDLVKGPLFKVALIKLSETEHHLILTAHHIVCDGWSLGIMLEELGNLYSANLHNTNHSLPKPESFSDYAEAQHAYLESEAYKINEMYWLNQFKDDIAPLTLPTDYPRPTLRTYKSERLDVSLETDLVDALKKIGGKAGCSFVTTLLSAFEIFLLAQTGQNDIVLGLPSADQAASGKTQMIGHCVNLLPLRSKIDVSLSFNEYLKQRKPQLFDAYEHQQLSFGHLLQKLSIARDPSRVPLVPVVFNIDMGMSSAVSFSGLNHQLKSNPRAYETFELFLNATGSADDLILEWSYNSSLFKPDTIKQMMKSFEDIITTIVTNPNIKIGDIIKVDDSAYVKLNNTRAAYPQLPLHDLISEASQKYKQKTAIKFGRDELSYQSLNQKVNQLSHALIERGVTSGHIIGVALPRSQDLVIALLAIMRCGAAYLPLDTQYPQKRLDFMLSDSEANFLITSKDLSDLFTNSNVLFIEDLLLKLEEYPKHPISLKIDNSQIAYILYTSGSTGQPKGVPISHKSLVNFLYSMMKAPGIEGSDRLLSITTISFDIAGLELFLPLLSGATLVIANEETAKDGRLLLECIKNESITMLQATPTTWQMLIDSGWVHSFPIKALCGGEQLPMTLAKKLLTRVDELWNMYGPTETTIWSTTKQILVDDKLLTIGKPIANTQVYILNEQGFLMEAGSIGEIVIGGDGVAQGYWKREDLTAQKFIANQFDLDSDTKLYRTGDLGRLLSSGEIQCLGRMDDQVKIRGHRIELGEIEEAINTIDGIASAVVLIDNDRLKAFVTTKGAKNTYQSLEPKWKDYLKERLPVYMIPNNIITINEFPTTLNGKIDRKALANSSSKLDTKQDFNEAQTNSEQLIATIWQDCLGIDKIDIHCDFFELGGHSLLAVKIMSQLEQQTGNRLPLASLLEHPTIKKLAAYLDEKIITWDSLVPLRSKGTKVPLFLVHGADHNILIFKNLAENLDDDQPVYALQAKGLSGEIEPLDTVEDMASHYISEIKSVHPEGPYMLGGFSFGGIIAFEMAKQLKEQGKDVKIIALFDCYVYPHYYYSNPLVKKTISTFYNISQLFYMGFDMFSSRKNFKRRKDLLKLKIAGWSLRFKHGRAKQYQLQFNRSPKIDEMLELAFIRYNLIPQDIKVDLFRSTEDIYFAHDYKNLGWGKIALGGIRKHMMPGNHSELFLSPAVEECSNILQNLLDKENE